MAGDGLYLVTQEGVKEIPGMPPGNGRSVFPHGASFLGLFSGGSARVYWPSDTALRFARQNAIKMRADASVMECVELRQRAAALLDWRIECDKDDPVYGQAKSVLEKILRRIPRFLQYRENLLHALWFGRYAIGNRYAWEWIDGEKCVVVKSWHPIHGDKLVWKIDSDATDIFDGLGIRVGGVSGLSEDVRQWHEEHRRWIESTEFGWAYFPPPGKRELLVVHRHYIEDGEYEEPRNASRIFGVGIRDRIYWTWYQKLDALAWLMEFLERSAFGIELWYYPAGNPQAREELRQAAAERAGPNKNILLVPRPPGMEGAVYGVERIEPSLAGAQALKEIITDYFGHQIKRYILGQTLTTEAHATGLGSNLASIHLDTFLQIVRYDAINLQETITDQVVRRLVGWNWPGLDAQAFRFVIELERDDTREKLEALQAAFNMGLKIRAADLRELLDISDPGPEEEFLQNPAYRSLEQGSPGSEPPPPQPVAREQYSLPDDVRQKIAGHPEITRTTSEETGGTYEKIGGHWVRTDKEAGAGESGPNLPQHIYVSPNKESGLTLEQAREKLGSPEHRQFRQRALEVSREEGVSPKRVLDALGNWTTGSENSLILEFEDIPERILDTIAARLGKEYDQEAVATFVADLHGTDARWIGVFETPAEKVIETLNEKGIERRTIVELPMRKSLVLYCDEHDSLRRRIGSIRTAKHLNLEQEQLTIGRFGIIWDSQYDDVLKGGGGSQRMAQEQLPWFMNDEIVAKLSDKSKAWVAVLRRQYEARRLPEEERRKRLEEMLKEFEKAGCVITNPPTSRTDDSRNSSASDSLIV